MSKTYKSYDEDFKKILVSLYESGKRKISDDVVKELAEYYNVKVSDIID